MPTRMRICLVYDCLFPWTIGGAERWYRNLGERLAADGHDVTFLTRLQWDPADPPRIPGIRVIAVSARDELYGADGNRRIAPPLKFGWGVLRHLWRRGGDYDVVHTASFPYFSLLAAAVARLRHRFGLVVDWHEVWSRHYWRSYLGRAGGAIGYLVQLACVRVPHRAFCFSRLHAGRLRDEGHRGEVRILEGEYAGDLAGAEPVPAEPVCVYAGRHIREKRVPSIVPALARARERMPELRAEIFGDGPERSQVEELVRRYGLDDVVRVRGFVEADEVQRALRTALCLLHPSEREGYGLVVVEAAAAATPAIVVAGEDNAAVELIEPGVNGVVAASAAPDDLADAIVRVHESGFELRRATARWFGENARRLSLESSLDAVAEAYREGAVR